MRATEKKYVTGASDIVERYDIVFTKQRKRTGHKASWERTITESKLCQADIWICLQKARKILLPFECL